MDGSAYLEDVRLEFAQYRSFAEKALAQIPFARWWDEPAPGSNSAAIVVKHVAGNLRSRWTDFLTTDGEKPDRNRDGEFEIGAADDEAAIRGLWERGWSALEGTLAALRPEDLGRTVRIRGEGMTALQATQRSLAHTAMHVGQIVYIAKLLAGPAWKTLTIPRGRSADFNRDPSSYLRPR